MMEPTEVKRKLAVILAADAEGYTRLMREAEEPTLQTLTEHRAIIDSLIARHDGRIFGTAGDSVVAEFGSAVEAVRSAIEIQEELAVRNAELADDRKLRFRIGINLGDVMVKGDDLFGDGVNVAARLEGLAEPGGICVSESVFEQVKHKMSLSFQDIGAQQVKNIAEPVHAFSIVPGSVSMAPAAPSLAKPGALAGWRMPALAAAVIVFVAVGGVVIWDAYLRQGPAPAPQAVASKDGQALPSPGKLAIPDKPSIAVLPFENLSQDREQEYFSNGITNDIITDLSKFSNLFVIASTSVFTYKGKSVKVDKIGRELGVRYILEGSVQKAGNRVRINAQLIDAPSGHHLWAERYDRSLKDIFALQDEISGKIVAALQVKLAAGEKKRPARRYTDNVEAYEVFLRAMEVRRAKAKGSKRAAYRLLEKAIELDPGFAAAYAVLSRAHWGLYKFRGLDRAVELAKKAVALDPSLPLAHARLGWAYMRKRQHAEAIAEGEKALALDPGYADGYSIMASILNNVGRPEDGMRMARKAMRLNPHYPFSYIYRVGQAQLMMGQTEQALVSLERAKALSPRTKNIRRHLVVLYDETGRKDKARAQISELIRLDPWESVERTARNCAYYPKALKWFADGLRKAGYPEKVKVRTVVTVLGKVKKKGRVLVITDGGKDATVRVNRGFTNINIGGKTAKSTALKAGMNCTISYLGSGTKAKKVLCK